MSVEIYINSNLNKYTVPFAYRNYYISGSWLLPYVRNNNKYSEVSAGYYENYYFPSWETVEEYIKEECPWYIGVWTYKEHCLFEDVLMYFKYYDPESTVTINQ